MTDLVGAVRQLLLYNLWADRICLKALEQVAAEDLTRDTGTSFGSLLGTLAHILASQRLWLARFEGKAIDRVPDVSAFPDWETLTAAWGETSAELGFFLASLSAVQLTADMTWTSTQGVTYTRPLWQPVLHLVNHGTYHRGQVVSQLRQLGYEPPSTDMIYFLIDQAPAAPAAGNTLAAPP
ncbi:MAG TPA: DinB family protein [Thermoanaerobaculia bacterium]|nr:DinB family protein [Thermoanaerobaculia bacterium]